MKIASVQKSDKDNFKAKNVTRYKKSHFIIIKQSINQANITILKVYVPTMRTSKYVKQKLIQ